MKRIRFIDKLRTQYTKYHIGEQAELEETPFQVSAGRLASDGSVYNHAAPSIYTRYPDFTLVAITNAQVVVRTVKNRQYRRLCLFLRQTVTKVSYDFRLVWEAIDFTGGLVSLGSEVNKQARWQDDALSANKVYTYDGLVPYGETINCDLIMDNNHATDDMIIESAFLFYDPVC